MPPREHVTNVDGIEMAITCNVDKGQHLVILGTKDNVLKINIQRQSKYGLDYCAEDQYYDKDLEIDNDLKRELMAETGMDYISSIRVM
ncbi:hypothetical protein [Desulfosediminicola flagellatus]|uniref:hypothetical protein n=1 Tax=Desulfosediminicola flagellatus TaxID=2569541 RepID=UPI0010ACE5FB|nr:hypothetical protein [Desulfosediminicola flagellatus]